MLHFLKRVQDELLELTGAEKKVLQKTYQITFVTWDHVKTLGINVIPQIISHIFHFQPYFFVEIHDGGVYTACLQNWGNPHCDNGQTEWGLIRIVLVHLPDASGKLTKRL